MSSYSRIAAVTGSNKGIGLACVRQLALQYPKSAFNNGPFLIYLTARNQERGEAALKSIHEDPQLKSAKVLQADGGLTDIKYLALDIDSKESISDFAAHIKREHPDGIDMVINNAGIAISGFDADVVKQTLACNYHGTLQANKQILPQIRDGGRLVNVASMAGILGAKYSKEIKSRFVNAKSIDEITGLMDEFSTAVEKNAYQEWPPAAYSVSKAGVIGMTKVLARDNANAGSKTLINVCCPGYVRTDMTKGGGVKSVDEGAMTPVLLALGDIKGSNGEFWQDERIIKWVK